MAAVNLDEALSKDLDKLDRLEQIRKDVLKARDEIVFNSRQQSSDPSSDLKRLKAELEETRARYTDLTDSSSQSAQSLRETQKRLSDSERDHQMTLASMEAERTKSGKLQNSVNELERSIVVLKERMQELTKEKNDALAIAGELRRTLEAKVTTDGDEELRRLKLENETLCDKVTRLMENEKLYYDELTRCREQTGLMPIRKQRNS